MSLDLKSLRVGDRVRLRREISGYPAGTVGTVVESLSVKKTGNAMVPAVLIEWPTPAERFGPAAKPTRDEFTQTEQDRLELLELAGDREKRKPMKIYRGRRQGEAGPEWVEVIEGGRGRPLKHHCRHSPDGFQWGYGGSGPADLARSILADVLGSVPAPYLYQAFKWQFVAKWGDQWEITEQVIRSWVPYPWAGGWPGRRRGILWSFLAPPVRLQKRGRLDGRRVR